LSLGALAPLSPPQAANKNTLEIAAVATNPRKDIFPHQKFINDIGIPYAKMFFFNIILR
jgi:hypothetical protein